MNSLIKNKYLSIVLIVLPVLSFGMTSIISSDQNLDYQKTLPETENFQLNNHRLTNLQFANSQVEVNKQGDTVLAKVGKYEILLKDYLPRYTDYLFATGVKDNYQIRTSILQNMVNELLLRHFDDNSSILSSKDYKDEMVWTKKQAILGYVKDQEVYAKISVTEDELRQAFERVNEQIAARHLYAPTEEEANYLYNQLEKGVSFDSLAKQVFTDSTLRNNGGYLGYFTWGDMDSDFEDAAYALKPGEISKPVKTVYGYSIIKLEDRKPHPLLTENEYLNKKHKMERTLKIKKKGPAEREFLKSVFNESEVKFNDKALENVLNELLSSGNKVLEIKDKKLSAANCVEYQTKKYSSGQISKQINEIPFFHRDRIRTLNNLKDAIKGLILQDKLLKIARSKGYDKNFLVEKMYDKLGKVVFLRYKLDEVLQKSYVPDSSVRNFYANNIKQFTSPDELNIQEILVTRASQADSLKEMIEKQGMDFGSLAEKYSMRQWSAKNKGEMGFAPVSKYGMFKDRFWNASVGELIGPMKIENMYGLFRVVGKKQGKTLDFELVKDQAKAFAKKEMTPTIMHGYLDHLSKNVKVTIYSDLLSNYKLSEVYSK
ncbi:MAG: peptidylprolyl isomerase [Bacillota bacterium]